MVLSQCCLQGSNTYHSDYRSSLKHICALLVFMFGYGHRLRSCWCLLAVHVNFHCDSYSTVPWFMHCYEDELYYTSTGRRSGKAERHRITTGRCMSCQACGAVKPLPQSLTTITYANRSVPLFTVVWQDRLYLTKQLYGVS